MSVVPTNWRTAILTDRDFGVLWPERRGLVAAAVLGLILWLSFDTEFFIMYLATMLFFLGLHWGERCNDVTEKPLSFCLPGYKESLRKRHFMEGGLVGLALALWLLQDAWSSWSTRELYSDLPAEFQRPEAPELMSVALGMIGSFFAAMAVATAISALAYSPRRWVRVVALISGVICVFVAIWFDLPGVVWFALLSVWLALGFFAWRRLGDIGYVTQGHRMFINKWRDAVVVVQVDKKRRKASRAEGFLLALMKRQDRLTPARYYWNEIHQSLSLPLSYWPIELIVLAVCALVLGLAGEVIAGIGFVLSGLMALNVNLPLAPDQILLLPAGRRERCIATGMKAIVMSLLLMAFGTIIIASSWLLWLLVWASPGKYLESAFSRIEPTWLYWPCLLVPWAVASRLLRGWALRIVQGSLAIVALLLVAGVYLLQEDKVSAWRIHAIYACTLVSGWLLLLMALRLRHRAGDLI